MKIGEFLKTTKGKVISIGGGTVIAVGIVLAVLLQGGGYRSILVEQVEGTANVTGERNNGPAYSGERLYSGDDVSVMDDSSLTMCMDNDKYVYADANTHFSLEASSAKDDSRIRIILDKGSELNVLKSKLGPDDSYEVDTPNSTMSVRGTIFRVTVYTGKDGLVYTLLEVKEGFVFVKLKTQDGTFNGVEREFKAGESALIRGNFDFSEFVQNDEGVIERHLDYDTLPEDSVERLIALLVSEDIIEEDDIDIEEPLGTETNNTGWDKQDETLDAEGNTLDEDIGENDNNIRNTSEDRRPTDKEDNKSADNDNNKNDKKSSSKKTDSSSGNNTSKNKNTSTADSVTNNTQSDTNNRPTEQTATQKNTSAAQTAAQNTSATQTATERNTSATQTAAEKKTETTAAAENKTEEEKTEHVHTPGSWEIITAATCTTAGTRQKKCTTCGEVTDTDTIAATGHDWSSWTVTVAAKCTTAGSRTRTCNNCGETETARIAALGHNWVTRQLTYNGVASGEETVCSRCGISKD